MTTAVALPTKAPVPTPAPVLSKPAPAALLSDAAADIPIFLRKTYHMVDTCDPTVACWSEDGETFVVKNPEKFEKQIIPQFFKHSKFSSFVRQLNFYAFRKIKYADTIRIDPKLEAETANYWRFRHEKFQRGKPELLGEIKRMNGQKGSSNTANKKNAASAAHEKENVALKSEVSQLKSKLEQMTKNIDELTSLVQKVSLQQQKQEQQTPPPAPTSTVINANNKRTKVEDTLPPLPDIPQSFGPSFGTTATTANTTSNMEVDDFSPPSIPSPMHPTLTTSETPSELSDDTFVDQLFTAFKTEHFDFEDTSSQATPKMTSSQRASPELMAKLSDALATLPLQIQELIVNRLIQAITAPKEIQDALPNLDESIVPQSPPSTPKSQTPNLPLAAATLAALLAQYGEDAIKAAAKDAAQTNNAKHQANTANSNRKALLIPVHA